MNDRLDYFGLKFKLLDKTSGKEQLRECLLVESFEDDYVFQIVCITGYDSGRLLGYVKKPRGDNQNRVHGVARQYLIKELHRNIIFHDESLVFLD
jgi:hypothetical protein